jgi:hypothetical protein
VALMAGVGCPPSVREKLMSVLRVVLVLVAGARRRPSGSHTGSSFLYHPCCGVSNVCRPYRVDEQRLHYHPASDTTHVGRGCGCHISSPEDPLGVASP